MAASERRARRGPAPIASFDHDGSDESSPETKQTFQLPEIREDAAGAGAGAGAEWDGGGARARSHSTPGPPAPGLHTPAAPRIDISRASSSSHHDSRDSSPELALFAAGGEDVPARLGFREDGALDLRSSTEELAFLEPTAPATAPSPSPAPAYAPASASACASRRHSRKDSQGSEAALLAVSGRTSRISSVGSQCSALSGLSHVSRASRLSAVSAASRSPSPHRMLLETSFCGPKPIETDPEICAAAVEERLLEIAKSRTAPAPTAPAAPVPGTAAPARARDERDRREVRTEATVETAPRAPAAPPSPACDPDKRQKETSNAEQRRARSRERRDHSQPEVYKTRNRSKDIIRIKLKPKEEYDEASEEDEEESCAAAAGAAAGAARPTELAACPARRSPSPAPHPVSRKSSFCSLFKSRETVASPESPSDALRRKKSLTEGRSRSRSRDRPAAPAAASKLRGSVLSLFKTPKRGAASPSPASRAASPAPAPPAPAPPARAGAERLKYYEDDVIIHIPLRTPPGESGAGAGPRAAPGPAVAAEAGGEARCRPASAPLPRLPPARTVLPDGSIIIPLRSPTEARAPEPPEPVVCRSPEADRSAWAAGEARAAIPPAASGDPTCSTASGAASSTASGAGPERHAARRERLVFTTHVGSAEQVFSTQLSITKTPSVASEMSESAADEARCVLRDTHIAADAPPPALRSVESSHSVHSFHSVLSAHSVHSAHSPHSAHSALSASPSGDSSLSSAEAVALEVLEERVLVVQDSFEEELPYVPTTLPLERSLALPMVPVRDRSHHRDLASVERPRASRASTAVCAARVSPPAAAPAPPSAPASADKLRIKLPRRARPAQKDPPPPPAPLKTSGDTGAVRGPAEWIDFSEVPERRKPPKRIQTLPGVGVGGGGGGGAGGAGAVLSYAQPEDCRCECHAATAAQEQQHG